MAGKPNANKGKGKTASSKSASSAVLSSADDSVDIQKGQADVEAAVTKLENSSSEHNCDGTSLEEKKLSTEGDCNNILETTEQEESATKMEAVSHLEGAEEQGIDLVTVKGSSGEPKGTEEQHLYPMTVKGPSGEQIELQVSPTDSVMDLRQFLLDAPETCFYTCYDLILHGADGTKYQLAEYLEIGEVANISVEGCSLEMVNAPYDDRSIRSHVRRTRDLISTASIYSSLSTVLALDYEKKQANSGSSEVSDAASSKSKPLAGKEEGTAKTEAPELEGLGFMEDQAGMLGDLVSGPVVEEVKCVKSISFSSFNPVPGYRRLRGDLIYIDIVSLENKSYCVTAHTQGFYVNSSSGEILDPTAVIPALEGTTLIGLLHKISPLFTKGFSEVLERKAAGHPFELVPVVLPPNAWLGHYPPQPHRRDIGRAEEALVAPYGTETIGMQRDWNEELQSCKEFPRETSQDRIMRDRALYKVNCDFVDAAIKGAKAVIGRCIPPINPTDPERFHMYVHNNIFFSFAVDGDFMLMQQSKGQESLENSEGNLKTKEPTSINEETEHSTEPSAALSSTPDLKLEDNSVQPIDGEQATYASANNDLKGTKAYNSADVAGLYTLAMAIVDFRGHRVVAQSIIPGILQGDKTETLLYGSIDNGKKISWNEKFHVKVVEAGKGIHIKEHEVLDGSGARIKICAPVECKGIVGSDNRYYILDLMRTTPRDVNYTGLGSRLCVLRPELVAAFCQIESSERSKLTKGEDVDTENGTVSPKKNLSPILLNPNVFTDFNVTGDPEEVSADEALVRKAGNYLVDTVLPKFVQDLSSLEVSPMDGQTLTEALHAHGINVRYLGKVAVLAKQLPHIWTLCVVEMVVRSAKHVLKGVLRETLDQDVGGAIAHFLNCFLGLEDASSFQLLPNAKPAEGDVVSPGKQLKNNGNGSSKRKKKDKGHGGRSNVSSNKIDSSDTDIQKDNVLSIVEGHSRKQPLYMCITSELVWIDIQENVKFKYQFELPDDAKAKAHNISTIRNLCLKVGITLAARHYVFDSPNPFRTEDILDLQAVVKHTAPVCSDAHNLLENGKLRLAQGKLNEAYEMFSEAFGILQQVCGPMHREVSNCCRYLAMVLYHAGDLAGAIMQQHKELIINERCLGPDHPDTAHSYGNMALFYHGLNQSELALRHMARTLLLLSVSCGSDHPDVAATFINVAVMYQEIGRMHVALRYLQEALKRNERLLGPDHIQTAICYHALAIAFNCMKAFKLSIQHERSTYNILLKQLGEEDSRTRESANWIKTFQIREMQASAEKQKGQQQAVQKAAEVIKAFQAASAGSMRGSIPKIADAIPRSRGMDERGARAAAEVRKKAAAKGLNVRSLVEQNGPVTELLGLSNNFDPSGKIPLNASVPRVNKAGGKPNLTKSDSQLSKETKEAALTDEDPVKTSEMAENKAPLGLGAGLGMLEAKKQKSKQK